MIHNSSLINQAILLSAGLGTRLRDITKGEIPKVMVPLLGKPLLEWHLEAFKKYGVSDFFINLHYLPEVIKNYFGDGSKWGVKIQYNFEPEIMGTAGGIKGFSAEGGSASGGENQLADNFFVIYADTFYQINYNRIADLYFSLENPIGLGTVRITDHPEDSDLAIVGENNEVKEFLIKPHKKLPEKSFYGTSAPYIFSKKILEYIPENKYYEIDHNLVPDLLARGFKYYAYKLKSDEFRKDIGTADRYHFVENYLKNLK